MKELVRTTGFRRDLRRMARRGKDVRKIQEVTDSRLRGLLRPEPLCPGLQPRPTPSNGGTMPVQDGLPVPSRSGRNGGSTTFQVTLLHKEKGMVTRRPTHQPARAGEYYVAAELNRRGYDAVTFTGNMPGIDVLAVTADNRTLYIQVKTQRDTGGWQVDVRERCKPAIPDKFWVLVLLPKTGEPPRYWVIPDKAMKDIIQQQYDDRSHQFVSSNHCRVRRESVQGWEDGWCRFSAFP